MSSQNETGHAKNVANFDSLISFVTGFGAAYNPSKAALKLTALQGMATNAKNVNYAVNQALTAYGNAVAAREVAFNPLNKLVTRVANALKAIDTTPQVDDNAKTIIRKIQGTRATPKKTEAEKALATAQNKETREISSSQLSYDNRLENLDKLVKLLSSINLYVPNEADLKVTALLNLYNDLKAKNAAVVATTTQISNARLIRNEVLYKADTGLVDIALSAKAYVKSIYGASAPQYKQVSKLGFKAM